VSCGDAGRRAVIYLHGGGYCVGSPFSHRALAARIAQSAGATCFVPDYRLAPEYPFPAARDDALEAYRALLQQDFKPGQIAFAGDSAGGGLSIATALAVRDAGLPMPAALVLISPWTDLTLTGESGRTHAFRDPMLTFSVAELWSRLYTGTHPANHPGCSPLFADLRGLPPTLIQVGSEEILLDDSRRFAACAREAGADIQLHLYERMWHVFQVHAPLLHQSNVALAQIGTFLQGTLKN
jgi:acetyl esterase/lipase